jgi:site-specific recombinase XerD
VAILDFSGKPRQMDAPSTLETCIEPFLADLGHLERLRPHTLRAYRYELAAAAADPRLQQPLSELDQVDLEAWLVRGKAATSTIGRRIATFRHLFAWAIRRGLCTQSPLAQLAPLRGRRTLPRPIREQREQRALDVAIASAQPPYRLLFTLLRETGMRAGEVLELRWLNARSSLAQPLPRARYAVYVRHDEHVGVRRPPTTRWCSYPTVAPACL